jgi:hypothetical protein
MTGTLGSHDSVILQEINIAGAEKLYPIDLILRDLVAVSSRLIRSGS